jgi:F-type H+-transporting ATPase subunit a
MSVVDARSMKTRLVAMKMLNKLVAIVVLLAASSAHAAGMVHPVSYYDIILKTLNIAPQWVPTVGALFVTFLMVMIGLAYSKAVAASSSVVPDGKFSLRYIVEAALDMVQGLAKDNCGTHWREHITFLAALFFFILVSNLSGLVPGFPPPTLKMETNVAMGLFAFVVYNWAGIKEHGAGGYLKTFLGPVAFIAPLFFMIEMVSHASRPFSLGLRLAGNIFGDHTLLTVFTSLSYLVLPAALTFFGLLVAIVQSFVFTLLTGIYISMAMSHDH